MGAELQDVLQAAGVAVAQGGEHRHVAQGWLGTDCPWCDSPSGKFHLGWPPTGRTVVCWICGRHSMADTLKRITQLPWEDVKRVLRRSRPRLRAPVHTGKLQLPTGLRDLRGAHRRYLQDRGFDADEVTALWGLQATPSVGELAWRIWIPVYWHGELVSWTTRALGNRQPKYLSAPDQHSRLPLKWTLYGQDYAYGAVIVVEGPTDVWRIGPGAVATYGVQWTQQQAALLEQIPYRAIVYDNTPRIAQQQARRLARRINWNGRTEVLRLRADDPGEASPQEVRQLRRRVGFTARDD